MLSFLYPHLSASGLPFREENRATELTEKERDNLSSSSVISVANLILSSGKKTIAGIHSSTRPKRVPILLSSGCIRPLK